MFMVVIGGSLVQIVKFAVVWQEVVMDGLSGFQAELYLGNLL